MRSETFYATVAQVLPTILIALAVEANLLASRRRERLREIERRTGYRDLGMKFFRPMPEDDLADIEQRAVINYRRIAVIAGTTFFGECAAISALMFGASAPLTTVAGLVAGMALLILTSLAAVLPCKRMPTTRFDYIEQLISPVPSVSDYPAEDKDPPADR